MWCIKLCCQHPSWLYGSWSSSLLMHLGREQNMAQVFGTWPPMSEIRIWYLTTCFSQSQICPLWTETLFPSVSLRFQKKNSWLLGNVWVSCLNIFLWFADIFSPKNILSFLSIISKFLSIIYSCYFYPNDIILRIIFIHSSLSALVRFLALLVLWGYFKQVNEKYILWKSYK